QVFWTASPLLLMERFGLGAHGIALFAFAGAGGALVAPLAGRLADRGHTRVATGAALALAIAAFGLGAAAAHWHSLAGLVIAALVVDAAVQMCQVLSLRSLFMLAPETRGRINGLFMAFVFVCGAAGSGLAAAVYAFDGWSAVCALGAAFGAAALAFYFTEQRGARPAAVLAP
ncbi:MAG: MFS transporter, partial [Variovorax sp.]